MIILPAIDIHKGQCVRLTEGVFASSEKVADDYLETALSFEKAGASWVHMVDLDGALHGEKINSKIFIEVAEKTGLNVQLGGGIRSMEDISYYLDNGISRVILGSVVAEKPELVEEAVGKYGDKIAVGLDARDGMLRTRAWLGETELDYIEAAKKMENIGVKTIIYTDISKDGAMKGPDFKGLENLKNTVSIDIIASGGIRNIEDIKELAKLDFYGAICGKSIYQGTLDLKEAIHYGRG